MPTMKNASIMSHIVYIYKRGLTVLLTFLMLLHICGGHLMLHFRCSIGVFANILESHILFLAV